MDSREKLLEIRDSKPTSILKMELQRLSME